MQAIVLLQPRHEWKLLGSHPQIGPYGSMSSRTNLARSPANPAPTRRNDDGSGVKFRECAAAYFQAEYTGLPTSSAGLAPGRG